MQIAILNTSIITTDGMYTLRTITVDEARSLVTDGNFISAVGHEATAHALTTILGVQVPMNRIMFEQQLGQRAVVFKLNGRLPEGQVLSLPELTKIGYTLKLMERVC